MITKIGRYFIFYRHFLYGSALLIGTLISIMLTMFSWISLTFLCISILLMFSSLIVTYTINRYPEEFREELQELE